MIVRVGLIALELGAVANPIVEGDNTPVACSSDVAGACTTRKRWGRGQKLLSRATEGRRTFQSWDCAPAKPGRPAKDLAHIPNKVVSTVARYE
jgi:hypothetical protein